MHTLTIAAFLVSVPLALGARSCRSTTSPVPVLTERSLGAIDLTRLDPGNIQLELLRTFPYCAVEKGIGEQDGPDFLLYEVQHEGESIVFVSMDHGALNGLREVAIQTPSIRDEYGIRTTCEVADLLNKRPEVSFHADLHSNVYATVPGSRIGYRMAGPVSALNDSVLTRADFSLERWQVGRMKVGFLIWSK